MFFDPLYLIVMIPVLILSGIASATVKGTFSKYSKTRTSTGMTGAEAVSGLMEEGVLAIPAGQRLRLLPPLTISEDEIKKALDAMHKVLD